MDTNINIQGMPVEVIPPKKKIKKCYNRACMAMIFQMIIALVLTFALSFVYTTVLTMQIIANEKITDHAILMQRVAEETNPALNLLFTAIAYLIANPVSYLIGKAMTKKHYDAKIFGKIQLPAVDCVLSVFAVLGLQMISLIIQNIITRITHTTGVDEATMAMMSFSDNMLQNVTLVVYTVIVAAVTEELLCHGFVMKVLSPVSSKFALFASSLIFGIMHGNFNQMFNGFLLGLLIGYAGMKSKSILLPIIIHMCANGHAMLISFLEYKLGESFIEIEGIYIIVMLIIGIAAAVVFLKRNGKIDEAEDGFPCTTPIEGVESPKGLCWKALLTTPCFWIFTVIYFAFALSSVTAL